VPVLSVGFEILPDEALQAHVQDVVRQGPADEELHREVADLLGLSRLLGLLGEDPALHEHVPNGVGESLEALTRVGARRVHDVVEHEVPVVEVTVVKAEGADLETTQLRILLEGYPGVARVDR
jgi:hypothetical protein